MKARLELEELEGRLTPSGLDGGGLRTIVLSTGGFGIYNSTSVNSPKAVAGAIESEIGLALWGFGAFTGSPIIKAAGGGLISYGWNQIQTSPQPAVLGYFETRATVFELGLWMHNTLGDTGHPWGVLIGGPDDLGDWGNPDAGLQYELAGGPHSGRWA